MSFMKTNNCDSAMTLARISQVDDYRYMKDIIKDQLERAEPNRKFVYKLLNRSQQQQNSSTPSQKAGEPFLDELENRFFAIKVKKQTYMGKPAIAIYLSDTTKKIRAKILKMQRQELQ